MSSPSIVTIDVEEVQQQRLQNRPMVCLDVRTPVEYRSVHAEGTVLHPLDKLNADAVRRLRADDRPLYIFCKGGSRAAKAARQLMADGIADCRVVVGGTDAWLAAGYPVVRGKPVMSLERQVRIAAGSLVLTGVGLAYAVHPGFIGLSVFVGAGLVFAGITDWCGMGLLLARMPWNARVDDAAATQCSIR